MWDKALFIVRQRCMSLGSPVPVGLVLGSNRRGVRVIGFAEHLTSLPN